MNDSISLQNITFSSWFESTTHFGDYEKIKNKLELKKKQIKNHKINLQILTRKKLKNINQSEDLINSRISVKKKILIN